MSASPPLRSAKPLDAIGARESARRRVDGTARFAADVIVGSALEAAFVLSPIAHGGIRQIDVATAVGMPGVEAVITGRDIGLRQFGRSLKDYPVLAVDRVLFAGQRVAAVAAIDAEIARRAADAVVVEYDELKPVDDIASALVSDVELHPNQPAYIGAEQERWTANVQGGRAQYDEEFDVGLAEADEVFEHRFSWTRNHAAPLEPHACVVAVGDHVHVYSSHKEPYSLKADLAALTGRDEGAFVIHPVYIGGDFGVKASPLLEAACYYLSVATGRPVRTSMSYHEELSSTSARHPGTMRLRTGLKEGSLHAHEAETLLDGGAFAAMKPSAERVVNVVGVPLSSYRVEQRDERAVVLYSNNLPGGHVRSPGEFQALFAGESHIDMIARHRGEDPLEFRRRNCASVEIERILTELQSIESRWRSDGTAAASGIGVSVFHRGSSGGKSTVLCNVTRDGVAIGVGTPDQGAGMYEVFRSLTAQMLKVPVDSVVVEPRGADPSLRDTGAGGSRVSAIVGRACIKACEAVLRELGDPPKAGPDGSTVYWIGDRLVSLGLEGIRTRGRWATARGSADHARPSYGGLAVEVEVDRTTGHFVVRRGALVVETGEVVNPIGHTGQLEGGFVYGLSQALYEELRVEDGQVVSSTLGDYKMASAGDVPPLDIVVLEGTPQSPRRHQKDIRGVGELANLGVPAAIANAIHDAVGVRVCDLPITAERVWRGLRRGGGSFANAEKEVKG